MGVRYFAGWDIHALAYTTTGLNGLLNVGAYAWHESQIANPDRSRGYLGCIVARSEPFTFLEALSRK